MIHNPSSQKYLVKLESRNLADASGPVAYIGYGFQPTSLRITALIDGGGIPVSKSIGYYDGATAVFYAMQNGSEYLQSAGLLVVNHNIGGASQTAVITSLDSDGFTLTWTKAGAPAGTLAMLVEASK